MLIDCTGNGEISEMAGAKTEYGRKCDGLAQPYTLVSMILNSDKSVAFTNIDCGRVNENDDDELTSAIIFSNTYEPEEKRQQGSFVKNMPLLKIEGVNSIDEAAKLRDKIIYIHRDDIPMEEGEYLIQDLMGLQVVDADDGHLYGELTQVSPTGANDVYHIRFADGKERLIPAIPQVVIEVDLDGGVMKIRPLEGLFDDED